MHHFLFSVIARANSATIDKPCFNNNHNNHHHHHHKKKKNNHHHHINSHTKGPTPKYDVNERLEQIHPCKAETIDNLGSKESSKKKKERDGRGQWVEASWQDVTVDVGSCATRVSVLRW